MAFRTYDDQWHGSHWDESTAHENLPSLSEILRRLFDRRRVSASQD
jgi:hypothetical protein